ncbi:NAD(P)H-dependent glycerol-3-phosphate dehydrogenase [Gynurincola endophyticus]|uniref:NAD(P)H-dependent glycerol-3-phosphate dehydrogenase n=1 Tax=Gynurincola endophyticus TaxID=2479004 RepID=UPI000F8D03DC|nr:NAD(P)H-dependent glycerol-3-phosphate dehydrogenase [Gynurincola endophyticus]
MKFGIIGNGTWATAIAKILTDNELNIHWWVRKEEVLQHIKKRHHNPNYLSSVYFDTSLVELDVDIQQVVNASDVIILATPSAYMEDALKMLDKSSFNNKLILSAMKGLMPSSNQLLNHYLAEHFHVRAEQYFTLMGPCHAEEVAAERLSYLTFSGTGEEKTKEIASFFKNEYISTVINHDVDGVQYAAILKNIYALGAGIAHALEYGDNFLSVYIANCANEMSRFLDIYKEKKEQAQLNNNYTASVYMGDLLVTCYSLHSRNRSFGNMIGKGYSVSAIQLEMNMVAEGYYAAKAIETINHSIGAGMPIAHSIYQILFEKLLPKYGFKNIENHLI